MTAQDEATEMLAADQDRRAGIARPIFTSRDRLDESRVAIERMFDTLPDQDAIRLIDLLATRFNVFYGHDEIVNGLESIAGELAQSEGWTGDELGKRYLGWS